MGGTSKGGGPYVGQSAPILTLSSKLPPRDTFTIDGAEYELSRYHDLTLHKHGKFGRAYLHALVLRDELFGKESESLSAGDLAFLEERTSEASTDAAHMVVRKCPKEELNKLVIEDRLEICEAFQRAVRQRRAWRTPPPVLATEEETGTGDASSTPSPPASGEAPAGGSAKPASESSLRPTGD